MTNILARTGFSFDTLVPTEEHVERNKPVKYFAYRVVGKTEYNGFDVPQTPQSFADDTEQRLTDPDFLEGDKRFALVVWALPEGVNHVDDVSP